MAMWYATVGTQGYTMASNSEGGVSPCGSSSVPEPDNDIDGVVRRIQQGDELAFDILVARVGGTIYNLAYRLSGSASDAEDLTQEVLVRLYRKIRLFHWQSRFTTWLYALAIRACRSHLRRRWRSLSGRTEEKAYVWTEGGVPADVQDPSDSPDRAVTRAEISEVIQNAIAELPREFREAVVLRDIQGLSYEEISAVLGISSGTVKSRISRGRIRLRDRLGPLLGAVS